MWSLSVSDNTLWQMAHAVWPRLQHTSLGRGIAVEKVLGRDGLAPAACSLASSLPKEPDWSLSGQRRVSTSCSCSRCKTLPLEVGILGTVIWSASTAEVCFEKWKDGWEHVPPLDSSKHAPRQAKLNVKLKGLAWDGGVETTMLTVLAGKC